MWASAEPVLGAVHGRAGLSLAAASVSGNLGASIKPVLTAPRKPWETENRTWAPTGSARPRGAAGSPRTALAGGSLAAGGGALPGARPSQEPPSEATWGSQWGARWRARDPRFPGPCGGTGHVDTTRGASGGPVGLSRSRGESSTLAPLSHPSLDGRTWCWGSPNRSLVHGYGALYWKALRRNPHPGQQGQPASWEPRVPVPFRAGQRGRASPRLWVAVSSWRKAFSLWNFQHSRLPGPRVQSVPQVPPLVAPSRQKHRKEPSALARRRPTACLQFWEPAEGLSDAGRLGGPSRGQASTQLTVGAGRRAWRRSTEKERSQEMME